MENEGKLRRKRERDASQSWFVVRRWMFEQPKVAATRLLRAAGPRHASVTTAVAGPGRARHRELSAAAVVDAAVCSRFEEESAYAFTWFGRSYRLPSMCARQEADSEAVSRAKRAHMSARITPLIKCGGFVHPLSPF